MSVTTPHTSIARLSPGLTRDFLIWENLQTVVQTSQLSRPLVTFPSVRTLEVSNAPGKQTIKLANPIRK